MKFIIDKQDNSLSLFQFLLFSGMIEKCLNVVSFDFQNLLKFTEI